MKKSPQPIPHKLKLLREASKSQVQKKGKWFFIQGRSEHAGRDQMAFWKRNSNKFKQKFKVCSFKNSHFSGNIWVFSEICLWFINSQLWIKPYLFTAKVWFSHHSIVCFFFFILLANIEKYTTCRDSQHCSNFGSQPSADNDRII